MNDKDQIFDDQYVEAWLPNGKCICGKWSEVKGRVFIIKSWYKLDDCEQADIVVIAG